MGNNSIRNNVTVNDVISEIRMFSSADRKKKIVIVEGIDDLKLISKFVNKDIIVKESFNGKAGVLKIKEVYKDKNNIIGIVDKDYDENYLNKKGLFLEKS